MAVTMPALAGSASSHPEGKRPVPIRKGKRKPQPLPILVRAKPDPLAAAGHDPYVAFELTRAKPGRKYRIETTRGPSFQTTCVSSLTTEWTPAVQGGRVPFDLEPVASGKYYDFPGFEPCHGTYVLKVEWRASGTSQPTVRRFTLGYPAFKLTYLRTRP